MRGERYQLHLLSPVLNEMLQIIDVSYTVNGEIHMDYTRFNQLLPEARDGLGRLGIQLPNLNEGGDGTIFNRELRRITACARVGDIAEARGSQRPAQKASVQNSPSSSKDWVAVLGIGALGLALTAILLFIAAQILWSTGTWVVNNFREPTPYPTFTPSERCLILPDECYLDDLIAQDEYWDRMAEEEMRWQAAEYERLQGSGR